MAGGQRNFKMAGIDRTQTNGIIKKMRRGKWKIIVAGNDRTQPNGIIKKWEGGSEVLWWMEMTGLKPIGLVKTERVAMNLDNGWKWQDSIQWDY